MRIPLRNSALILLIALSVLWTGCDTASTGSTDVDRPSVQFSSDGIGAVPTDSTVEIGVTLTDAVGEPVRVEVLFAAAASTASFDDVGGFSPGSGVQTVEFSGNAEAGATRSITVDVSRADLSEGSKEAFFALQNLESAGDVEIGTPREFGLSIGAKPIADARSEGVGTTVTIRGTVSRAFGAFARIQDDSGPTGASGLSIRQTFGELSEDFQDDISTGRIRPGTEILLTGTISAFSGLLQVNNEDLASYSVIAQGDPPEPQTVSLSDLEAPDGEGYESELLRVEGLSFPDASGEFESGTTYTVQDETGTTFEFRVQDSDETDVIGEPIPESTFAFVGVLGQFNVFGAPDLNEGYQFIPVRPSDLQ